MRTIVFFGISFYFVLKTHPGMTYQQLYDFDLPLILTMLIIILTFADTLEYLYKNFPIKPKDKL